MLLLFCEVSVSQGTMVMRLALMIRSEGQGLRSKSRLLENIPQGLKPGSIYWPYRPG
jgi:hypothetical protein